MTDNKDQRKNSNRFSMGSGSYNPEISDFIQDDVVSFSIPTPKQPEVVDVFSATYVDVFSATYYEPDEECIAYEWGFPESQYITHGIDADTAIQLSESWRRGEYLPIMGHPADVVSRKLNQLTNQRDAVEK